MDRLTSRCLGFTFALFLLISLSVFFMASESKAAPLDPVLIPSQMTAAQADAVRRIPDLQAITVDQAAIPSHIRGDLGTFRADAAVRDMDAAAFLEGMRSVLRANGSESLNLRKSTRDSARGVSHYRMKQMIHGIEVIGGEVILHVEEATSRIMSIDAQFLPGTGLAQAPSIVGKQAIDTALEALSATDVEHLSEPRVAYARTSDAKGHLVWVARIRYTDSQGRERTDDILADAITGKLVQRLPRSYDALFRKVNDYNTGEVLVTEGGSTTDAAAANVFKYSGITYSFFSWAYARDSWNDKGATMQAYVHGTPGGQGNAYFIDDATYFGNGDGSTFGSLANGLDVVAHEWTHGITVSEADLDYEGTESGALNESMSDVFGATVEWSMTGPTANIWRIGENVFTPAISGDALRYMNNPTQDGLSRDFYPELQAGDNVHYGSGIGNLAFYLLANGGTHPRGKTSIAISGIGILHAAKIYYFALRDYLQSNDGYAAARDKTARVALEQFGSGSFQHLQTCNAWLAVGVPNTAHYCPVRAPTNLKVSCHQVGKADNLRLRCTANWSASPGANYYQYWESDTTTGDSFTTTATSATWFTDVGDVSFLGFTVRACNFAGCSQLATYP